MTSLFDPKLWLAAIGAIAIAFCIGRCTGDNEGYTRCETNTKEAAHDQYVRDEKAGYAASVDFQKEQQNAAQQSQARRKIVAQIVERPVYHNVCFDTDGVQQLNAAIARAPASR